MNPTKEFSPVSTVLTVADVSLRSTFVDGRPGSYEPWYLPFVSSSSAERSSRSTIDIRVSRERAAASDAPLLFESGGAWNMQMEPQGYRLNFHRPGSQGYHTIACSDIDTKEVRVHVEQDEEESKPPPRSGHPEAALSPVRYPLDQLLLMNHLALLGGMIVHGAGAVISERAVVFAGVSGAGKSTLSQLFKDAGLGDSLLSDDRVILRRSLPKSQATGSRGRGKTEALSDIAVWGTPWPGDAGVARNATALLEAVLFLVKGKTNELRPLSPRVAARRIMPVVSCPWYDPDRLPGVMETCSQVAESAPCFELRFRADAEVVEYLVDRPWLDKGGSS